MINFSRGSSILNDLIGCEYWECWTEKRHYIIWELPVDALGCECTDCTVEYTPREGAEHYYRLTYGLREEPSADWTWPIPPPRVYTHVTDADSLGKCINRAREVDNA